MSMTIGGAVYANPYISYVPGLGMRSAGQVGAASQGGSSADGQDDGQTLAGQSAVASQVGAAAVQTQQPLQPATNTDEAPAFRPVEGSDGGAEGMRGDSMNRRYSGAQMDMLDLQAAFFGFSSRRTSDIPLVTMEEAAKPQDEVA